MAKKDWGGREFWGVGLDFDPDWDLSSEETTLRDQLIHLCRRKIRPLAIQSDASYEYPRESLRALSGLGLIGLLVPEEMGGLGQSHACAAMVVETLARYGCPSTAMVYSMHLMASAALLFRYHDNQEVRDLLRRMNAETLIGTTSYSDPGTGGHAWFPLTAKSQKLDDGNYRVFKFNSWTTGAGFADFYLFETPSPEIGADYQVCTNFLVYKDEVRASTDDWSALGLHGNQSGPLVFEGVLPPTRVVGRAGEGRKISDEAAGIFFFLSTISVWNGIAMGCIDLARKHARHKTHGDVGMRVCDYAVIQDYVGRCVSQTNVIRICHRAMASHLDRITDGNNWALYADPDFAPRSPFMPWFMQTKHEASENVAEVAEMMLKACGGDGYKSELGLERLLRDAKAGCLMAPTNEVVRNIIGKGSLIGLDSVDLWDKCTNDQLVHHEINKMTLKEKEKLLAAISADVERERSGRPASHSYQDTDFQNPFNTAPPKHAKAFKTEDSVEHSPALSPSKWVPLKLISREDVNTTMASFVFGTPTPMDHSGCLPGQYIQVRIPSEGKVHERYFSPVSPPNRFGSLELVLKFETHGIVSKAFKSLQIGDGVEFRGPCGGFEHEERGIEELTVISSGTGLTVGLQMARCVAGGGEGLNLTLIHFSSGVDDIFCREELEEMAEKDSRLSLVLTVGEPPEDWKHQVGFVDVDMLSKHVAKMGGAKHKVWLCGGATMTLSVLHSLRRLGVPPEKVFIYGQFGTEQIRAVYGRNARLSGHRCDSVGTG